MASAHPGLLGALLIALAAGWVARRLFLRPPGVFRCLAVGIAGALAGLGAAWAAAIPVHGTLDFGIAALGGAILVQALLALILRR